MAPDEIANMVHCPSQVFSHWCLSKFLITINLLFMWVIESPNGVGPSRWRRVHPTIAIPYYIGWLKMLELKPSGYMRSRGNTRNAKPTRHGNSDLSTGGKNAYVSRSILVWTNNKREVHIILFIYHLYPVWLDRTLWAQISHACSCQHVSCRNQGPRI